MSLATFVRPRRISSWIQSDRINTNAQVGAGEIGMYGKGASEDKRAPEPEEIAFPASISVVLTRRAAQPLGSAGRLEFFNIPMPRRISYSRIVSHNYDRTEEPRSTSFRRLPSIFVSVIDEEISDYVSFSNLSVFKLGGSSLVFDIALFLLIGLWIRGCCWCNCLKFLSNGRFVT